MSALSLYRFIHLTFAILSPQGSTIPALKGYLSASRGHLMFDNLMNEIHIQYIITTNKCAESKEHRFSNSFLGEAPHATQTGV